MKSLDPRWKGALAAALLFGLGAVAGAAGDRAWLGLSPTEAEAAPLTPASMAEALHLDDAQGARVRSVLDSLRAEVSSAAAEGPDSLVAAARRARQRLEEALPPDRRAEFVQWMQQSHERMMRRMGGGMMGGPGGMGPTRMQRRRGGGRGGMGPGLVPPDSGATQRMGPGMMRGPGPRGRGMMGGGMTGADSGRAPGGGGRMRR